MRKALIIGLVFLAASCGPSSDQIESAIAKTQTSDAITNQSTLSNGVPEINSIELNELIEFCRAFDTYTKDRNNFIDDFNSWLNEKDDQPDPDTALEFSSQAADLLMQVRDFPRPRIARDLHDFMIEAAGKTSEEMIALVFYEDNPGPETYEEYTELYRENIALNQHLLDTFNDLMDLYKIDPVSCTR